MLPEFPRLARLTDQTALAVKHTTMTYPCYSEFNAADLQAWDLECDTLVGRHDGGIVVVRRDYLSRETTTSILGRESLGAHAKAVLASVGQLTGKSTLSAVPQISIDIENCTGVSITCDDASADYILDCAEHAALLGPRFARLRHSVRNFHRTHGDSVEVHLVTPQTLGTRQAIQQVLDLWAVQTLRDTHHAAHESEALDRMLTSSLAELIVPVFYVDRRPTAFMVNELRSKTCIVGHFFKCDNDVRGLREYAIHTFLREAHQRGYQHVNIQMDLGIPGLRESKRALRPARLLTKYSLSLADPADHTQGADHDGRT